METIPTVFTEEQTLGFTIGAVLIMTFTACLRGVAWVNFDHLDSTLSSLVCDKVIELSKCPSMQSTLCRNILVLFATPNLARLSDVLEVFQDDGRTIWSVLN